MADGGSVTAARSVTVAAVVVAVILAGCGAAPGTGSGGESATTATATPATPVEATATDAAAATDATATQTPRRLAPGVTADGVVDATALVGAHVEALAGRSFTVTRHTRGVDPVTNETTREVTTTWRIDARETVRGRYESRWTTVPRSLVGDRRPPRVVDAYRADGTVLRRVVTDGDADATGEVNTTGDAGANVSFARPDLTQTGLRLTPALHREVIVAVGDAASVTVQPVARDDTRRYRLTARLPDDRYRTNRTVELLVTPDGRVTEIRQQFRSGVTDSVITRTVRFSAVGETRVERPAWYDAARNATAGASSTAGGNGTDANR